MSSPYGPYRLPPTPPVPASVRQAFRKRRLLNLRELTAAFGISERTIRRLAESGYGVCQGGELDPHRLFSRGEAAALWKSVQRAIQRAERAAYEPKPRSISPLPQRAHRAFAKKPLLDMHEFAAAFYMSERTLRRLVQRGHVTYQIVGGGKTKPRRRFSRDDAVRYWQWSAR